jgi:hypothetical protein
MPRIIRVELGADQRAAVGVPAELRVRRRLIAWQSTARVASTSATRSGATAGVGQSPETAGSCSSRPKRVRVLPSELTPAAVDAD